MSAPSPAELAEIARYRDDFLHYAPRALSIRTKAGRIEPLRLNTAQMYVHNQLQQQRAETGKVRALVLKGRQQGMSTYIGARFYHRTSMSFGKQALILTHLQDSTDALFDMTRRYHDLCPELFRPKTSAASAKELKFAELDSGYIVATAGSKSVGRGRTIQFFHGSEVAFWPNAADHMAGLGQAIPDADDSEIILETTANGVGNLFHGMCMDALKGKGDYRLIFVPWFWQTEYQAKADEVSFDQADLEYQRDFGLTLEQLAWRKKKIDGEFRGDEALFDQEYPATVNLAFRRVAGNPLIEPSPVVRARNTQPVEAIGVRIMGVDPAEYGDDASAIVKRQGRNVDPVIRYWKRGPMELVGLVAAEADKWKPDVINVDCTGVGSGVADRLLELGYPVMRVHFGERAVEKELYINRRAEMWASMRDWLNDAPACLPDDDALEADMTAPQYTYDSSRRLKLESKEDMRKRGVPSPDSADALALTFATPYAQGHVGSTAFKSSRGERRARRPSSVI